eukprot:1545355-Rhodomonas_salina.5
MPTQPCKQRRHICDRGRKGTGEQGKGGGVRSGRRPACKSSVRASERGVRTRGGQEDSGHRKEVLRACRRVCVSEEGGKGASEFEKWQRRTTQCVCAVEEREGWGWGYAGGAAGRTQGWGLDAGGWLGNLEGRDSRDASYLLECQGGRHIARTARSGSGSSSGSGSGSRSGSGSG